MASLGENIKKFFSDVGAGIKGSFRGDEGLRDVLKSKNRRARDIGEEKPAPYDPWEDIKNIRMSFFLGSWATKKIRMTGEDKLKADLEAIEKKREEKRKKKEE